jgi:hypothetical protein
MKIQPVKLKPTAYEKTYEELFLISIYSSKLRPGRQQAGGQSVNRHF